MSNTGQPQTFEYQAEMKQLLKLIIHSLYTHPEIFLRELVSNASDALNKVRFLKLTDTGIRDNEAELKIVIRVDKDKKIFSIEDTGIGMTRDELISNIGTIARSGTREFIQQLTESRGNLTEAMIGQFGVGFYSTFMVTDQVTIETCHASADSRGYRWVSDGEGTFTVEEIDRTTRGTKISFTLKESSQEFADEYRIRQIIRKYSNFADFPIYVGDEKVNTVTPLWQKPKNEIGEEELVEFYKFMANDVEPPLGHLHASLEGAVNFKALLFVPSRAPLNLMYTIREEKSLHLYSSRVLIQDDARELLPEYLRFVKGVVDTTDLPLNVSREVTQASPAMAKIRHQLTRKVIDLLEDWADTQKDKYLVFYRNYGSLLKTGITSDFEHRERLIGLLRFETTRTEADSPVSLKEYTLRMKPDQKEIYYLSGEDRTMLSRNPNLEYFHKNDIEVLLLTDPADIFTVPSIGEYEGRQLKSIEHADLEPLKKEEKKIEAPEDKLSASLLDVFKATLAERVENVRESKRLVDSPVTLVVGEKGMDTQLEKMMKMMDKSFTGAKKVLEVNMDHPIIRNLARLNMDRSNRELIDTCIEQLFASAQLLEGNLSSPAEYVQRTLRIMEKATK